MIRQLMRDGDALSSAVLAVLGAYIVFQASHWSYYGAGTPGPGFFPIWYGAAMLVLSLWTISSRIVKRPRDQASTIDWRGAGRALGTWLALVAAVALLQPLGFVLSFVLLAFFTVAVIFRRPPATAALVAVLAAAAFYGIFPVLLGVALPAGVLGF
jgi:putative tricarboxylic transport membrane protein